MFNRTRKKIILSIMGSLILLFAITLSVILFASYREIRQENMEMLRRHVELYGRDQEAGGPASGAPEPPRGDRNDFGPDARGEKQPPDKRRDYQLSTFYSVVFGEGDTLLSIDNGEKDVYSEEELTAIAREILDGNQASGRKGNLTYIVRRGKDSTLVAFMDNTVSESGLHTLLRNVLITGGGAIVLMFFLSLYLSKRIVRPLEENDRLQKQFISDASHELKTPAAVIGANAEMLFREIGENEWLSNIRYENERMGGLVKQLLDLSRAENAETQMETVDFSRITAGEALAFETLAFDSGRTIGTDIEEGIEITGNQTQLAQLVSILTDNAIRHSTGGEIVLSLKRRGRHAVLSVLNDGDEIPPEKTAHLFDRFYRADEARGGEGEHYGLGLSIAKAVTEKHGGSIGVSCGDGKVCFTVSLPL